MSNEWWRFENLPPTEQGAGWHEASSQGTHPDDLMQHHLDIGCGKISKARLGIDRNQGDIQMDLETGELFDINDAERPISNWVHDYKSGKVTSGYGVLPFPDNSINGIISHHFFEHLSPDGFINLIDDCYRVMVPGSKLRIIVPMMPSKNAYESSDHKMWIGPDTFADFCGSEEGEHWHESFATPYTRARFTQTAIDYTPAAQITGKLDTARHNVIFSVDGKEVGTHLDADVIFNKPRELRVTLTK